MNKIKQLFYKKGVLMMVKRKCLNCGAENYSADTFSEYWICYQCGSKIPKTEERIIAEKVDKE